MFDDLLYPLMVVAGLSRTPNARLAQAWRRKRLIFRVPGHLGDHRSVSLQRSAPGVYRDKRPLKESMEPRAARSSLPASDLLTSESNHCTGSDPQAGGLPTLSPQFMLELKPSELRCLNSSSPDTPSDGTWPSVHCCSELSSLKAMSTHR